MARSLLSTPVRSEVTLELANLAEATEVIVENHYLRRGRTMAQIAYWVNYRGGRCGVLLFALPRLSARTPKFGGHSPMELLELARLWIDPAVQGHCVEDSTGRVHALPVASMAIARALRVVRQDWHGKYPHLPEPRAVVAWSDKTLHLGTVYRASNFHHVGTSGGVGHRNNAREGGGRDQLRPDYHHLKDAFMLEYPSQLSNSQRDSAFERWEGLRPTRRNHRRSEVVSRLVEGTK